MSFVGNSNIKAFSVRFYSLKRSKSLPKSLSLHYYSRVRPDSTVFVTLHRVVNVKQGDALYTSTDCVRVDEGVRFAVYLDDERLMEGILVKDEGEGVWKLESRFRHKSDVAEVELSVALEGDVALKKRMEVTWQGEEEENKSGPRGFDKLQVIPEEVEEAEDESDGDECCWVGGDDGSDGGDEFCGSEYLRMETDLEGVRWAVDVGVWVMCFGLGFLVSRASAKSLRRSLIS